MTAAHADFDSTTFQQQIEDELKPLYLEEQSPVAAMRLRSRTSTSVAWLGPIALVGIVLLIICAGLPLADMLIQQGYGMVVVVVVPLALLLLARWLGQRQKAQQQSLRDQQLHIVDEMRALEPDVQEWDDLQERILHGQKLDIDEQTRLLEQWEEVGKRKAAEYLERQDVRDAVCPVLRGQRHDVFSIARTITPTLLDEIAAGTVPVPRVPLLFAALALQIHRSGIESVCGEDTAEDAAE